MCNIYLTSRCILEKPKNKTRNNLVPHHERMCNYHQHPYLYNMWMCSNYSLRRKTFFNTRSNKIYYWCYKQYTSQISKMHQSNKQAHTFEHKKDLCLSTRLL